MPSERSSGGITIAAPDRPMEHEINGDLVIGNEVAKEGVARKPGGK